MNPHISVTWQSAAAEAAEYVHKHLFSVHRGAVLWRFGVVVVFGNDGYLHRTGAQAQISERAERVISALRAELNRLDTKELGLGASMNGYTWAMLVRREDAEPLHRLIWRLDEQGFPSPSLYHQVHSQQAEMILKDDWRIPVSGESTSADL